MLELLPPFNTVEALRGLEEFSHVWVLFVFHQSVRDEWKATVRPPRLGGNERIGVFASRSNFRPNPIGLSVVELLSVKETNLKLGPTFPTQTAYPGRKERLHQAHPGRKMKWCLPPKQ